MKKKCYKRIPTCFVPDLATLVINEAPYTKGMSLVIAKRVLHGIKFCRAHGIPWRSRVRRSFFNIRNGERCVLGTRMKPFRDVIFELGLEKKSGSSTSFVRRIGLGFQSTSPLDDTVLTRAWILAATFVQ